MRFEIKHPGENIPIGFYELHSFPGCNQVCVFNHVLIFPTFRDKGFGKLAHEQRLHQARLLGYDLAICTVKADNKKEQKILYHFKWKYARSFWNKETGHDVDVFTRNLNDPWEEFGTV
jgi:RimJ/RimL family protein N-acetyltransferase